MPLTDHLDGCRCAGCACRAWLTYRPPGDRREADLTLHLQRFGGSGSGGGEPDRAYDRVCGEADFVRALGAVEPIWHRAVGIAARYLPPRRMPDASYRVMRPTADLLAWAEGRYDDPRLGRGYPGEWASWRHDHPAKPMAAMLDGVAAQMATTLGASFAGAPREREALPEPPPEFAPVG